MGDARGSLYPIPQYIPQFLYSTYIYIYILQEDICRGSWYFPNSDTIIYGECVEFMKRSLWSASMMVTER